MGVYCARACDTCSERDTLTAGPETRSFNARGTSRSAVLEEEAVVARESKEVSSLKVLSTASRHLRGRVRWSVTLRLEDLDFCSLGLSSPSVRTISTAGAKVCGTCKANEVHLTQHYTVRSHSQRGWKCIQRGRVDETSSDAFSINSPEPCHSTQSSLCASARKATVRALFRRLTSGHVSRVVRT